MRTQKLSGFSLSPAHSWFQVAPEYEARLAKILAVEDEDTICLADRMEKTQAVAGAGIARSMDFDPSTKMHHDAIFAPTGPAVPQPAAVCAPPAPVPASVVAGVMGAAARARLVLTGKAVEEPTTTRTRPKSPPTKIKAKTKANKTEKLSQPRKEEGEQPLFKSLRVCIPCSWAITAEGRVNSRVPGRFT